MTIAEQLAEFAHDLTLADMPPAVIASVKDRVMDTLGICVAATSSDAAMAARGLLRESAAAGPCTVIGEGQRQPASLAALVNGTCAHSLDFDDTHLPSITHPSAMLVPAILAQAEACSASGGDTIVALGVGYEIATRLAMGQYDEQLGNSIMFEHGLHASSIIGTVAAAAACARLRSLNAEQIADALGIACSMGAGLIEANRAGGTIKKFHGGWAAHSAVLAAAAAAHGLTAPRTVFEGRFGFFPAYCGDRWNAEAVASELGARWDTPKIFFKPYPCNHFTHAFVDAAMALKERGIRPDDVVHVVLGTAAATWRTIGDPIAEKRRPPSPYNAKFSAPFVFATALVGGHGLGVSDEDFTAETLREPTRNRLAEVTDVVVDDDCNRIFPNQFPGTVRVELRDGREVTERVLVNRGGPERPLSKEELLTKLTANAGTAASAIAKACSAVEEAPDVAALMAACG